MILIYCINICIIEGEKLEEFFNNNFGSVFSGIGTEFVKWIIGIIGISFFRGKKANKGSTIIKQTMSCFINNGNMKQDSTGNDKNAK